MKALTQWLSEYGDSHQNRTNKVIHYWCVPAIYMTVFGILWSVPFPLADLPVWVNWSTVAAIPALAFYFKLSRIVGISMTLFSVLVVAFLTWWQMHGPVSVLIMSIAVFVVAWVFQFVGHHIEGKKPSFFKDVQFLLVGPAWILCHLLNKWQIKY